MIAALLVAGFCGWLARQIRRDRLRARLPGCAPKLNNGLGPMTLAGIGVGFCLQGISGAWMGAAAGVILAEYKRRRDAKSRLIQMERQVPELIRALSANLRVGGNVSDAFHGIADELPEPIASPVRDLVRRLGTGVSIHEALHSFQTDAPTPSIERLTEAIRTSIEVGGSLESILGFIGEGVSDRIALDRERRAGTTQGRLSAIVVGGMPIGFLAITGLGESSPGRILFTEPIGWMLLLIGLMLEAAGFLWVKRIVRA